MFSKIMVAIDGSISSIKSLNHAASLSKSLGAQICVVTIIDELKLPFAAQYSLWAKESHEKLIQSVLEKLTKAVLDIRIRNEGLEIDFMIFEGDPAKTIIEVAEKEGFDLIVMGASGYGALDKAILGSISNKVLNSSKIPVLIVK
jgi:nucleotide-binding universal stress UspA family protein